MANPTFTNSGITYEDSNTTVTGVTGNNQYIVLGKSNLVVTLSASGLATASSGYTMSKYECSVGGKTVSVAHTNNTACTFDMGIITMSGLKETSSTMLTIKAIQSDGNYTEVMKAITIVPYSPPTAILQTYRTDPTNETIQFIVKGTFSPVSIGGTPKNKISKLVRYGKKNEETSYSTNTTTSLTSQSQTNGTFTHSTTFTGAIENAYEYYVIVTDSLSTTGTSNNVSIPTGIPLFTIDSKRGSIGAMCIPQYDSTFECGMRIDLPINQYWGNGQASYGLNARNSDIVGINSLVFNDVSNNLGEGLRFPNTTFPTESINSLNHTNTTVPEANSSDWNEIYGDYTTVFFRNHELWVDGSKFMKFDNSVKNKNSWNNNSITMWGKSYLLYTKDVDVSHDNGLILSGNDGFKCHLDANEIIFSYERKYSNYYLSATTHNLNTYDTSNTLKGSFRVSNDSTSAYCGGDFLYNRTYTYSSNAFITSNGVLGRATSSKKAKLDIVPAFDSIEEYKKILNIEPVKWFDKGACEINADVLTAELNDENYDFADIPNMNRVYGCVAEQLESVGLDCLVDYDNENKEIAGVAYDRIPIMYIPLLKDLYNQIDELKNEIKTLKRRI